MTPKERRESLRMTQEALAESAGVSVPTVAKVEAGGDFVRLATVKAIGAALKWKPSEMLAAMTVAAERQENGKD